MAKKRKYKKRKKTASRLDIAVVILIVLSILLAVLIYTKSGTIGIKLNEILGGIMGLMQYVLPIGGLAIAIKLASDGREEITSKLIQYGIALISLSIVFSVFQISSGELDSSKEMLTKEYTNTVIDEAKFQNKKDLLKGFIVFNTNGKYGVLNMDGDVIIGVKYDDITYSENTNEFYVKSENKSRSIVYNRRN